MKKLIFSLVLGIVFSVTLFAQSDCDCPEHPGSVNVKKTEPFDLIFKGSIDSISPCEKGRSYALFTGMDLYKGDLIPRKIPILFECEGACRMPFKQGDVWLIYAVEDSLTQKYKVKYCDRNRKYFPNPKDDEYVMYNESNFDEECKYLKTKLLNTLFFEEEDLIQIREKNLKVIDQDRNIEFATPKQKMIILACSSAFIILLVLVLKRFLK